MQEGLPYKTWTGRSPPISSPGSTTAGGVLKGGRRSVKSMVSENAVIVFSKHGCCMSHVVRRLLLGLGVNPAVYEVEEDDEVSVSDELEMVGAADGKGARLQLPVVFVGGKLFGGLDRVMATHISGELVPILKQAGALWL
ncbi:glutaredoxin-C9-like [Malania oleifera]|uniref:glutaredoxin-C9-like n=1 Tax=Malania oleifera TaxID=397392 RepID=UPI0025ADEB7C|nr:glutaredoxin-C9-like [Malania oleifera]